MPITFRCSCGQTLRVKDEFAGRPVKCPTCQNISAAPAIEPATPAFEVMEDEPAAPPPRPLARPVAAPVLPSEPRDEEDRPRKRKTRKRRKRSPRDDDYDPDRDDPHRGHSQKQIAAIAAGSFLLLLAILGFIIRVEQGRFPIGSIISGIFALGLLARGLTGNFDDQ